VLVLTWLGVSIVVLFAWLGVALVAVTLPGIWVAIAVAVLVDWWRPEVMSLWVLVAAVVLALIGEIVEFFASAAGSKRAGGTRSGAWGSLFGTVVGMILGQILIPIPIIGAVIGGVVGAGLGALFAERGVAERTWGESWRSGRGAATGRAVSIVLKTAIAGVVAVMLTVDAVAALF
jgi:uncharacterized protein YqgC (DUF456 family)